MNNIEALRDIVYSSHETEPTLIFREVLREALSQSSLATALYRPNSVENDYILACLQNSDIELSVLNYWKKYKFDLDKLIPALAMLMHSIDPAFYAKRLDPAVTFLMGLILEDEFDSHNIISDTDLTNPNLLLSRVGSLLSTEGWDRLYYDEYLGDYELKIGYEKYSPICGKVTIHWVSSCYGDTAYTDSLLEDARTQIINNCIQTMEVIENVTPTSQLFPILCDHMEFYAKSSGDFFLEQMLQETYFGSEQVIPPVSDEFYYKLREEGYSSRAIDKLWWRHYMDNLTAEEERVHIERIVAAWARTASDNAPQILRKWWSSFQVDISKTSDWVLFYEEARSIVGSISLEELDAPIEDIYRNFSLTFSFQKHLDDFTFEFP